MILKHSSEKSTENFFEIVEVEMKSEYVHFNLNSESILEQKMSEIICKNETGHDPSKYY